MFMRRLIMVALFVVSGLLAAGVSVRAAALPVAGMRGAISVVMSTDAGRHLYVAGRDDNAIAVFQQNANGSLSFVRAYYNGQDGVDGLSYVSEVVLSADNKHLYAVGRLAHALAVFSRNATTGELSFVQVLKNGENGVDGLHEASGVTISSDGKHVYATAGHDSKVSIFSRDATTGRLTYVSVLENGVNGVQGIGGSFPITVSPNDAHVYVGGGTENTIASFFRNPTTGALTYLQHITAGSSNERGLTGISGLAMSPDGLSLYAASWGSGLGYDSTLAVFRRDPATGELSFVETHKNRTAGGTIPNMWGALAVAVSPDSSNVYVSALFGNALEVFDRNPADGKLTYKQTVINNTNGVQGLSYVRDVIVAPDGQRVYTISRIDNALVWFTRSAGTLAFGDQYRQPTGLAAGVQKGRVNQPYTFSVELQGSAPFSYNWQTSDGQRMSFSDDQTATAMFQWATPGEKQVTVTATNRDGVFSQTMTLTIQSDFIAADQVVLQQTGQTACYDGAGAAVACADTGQDGDDPTGVAMPSPRFIKGGSVVTDTLTGLVWLKDADCIRTTYPSYDQFATAGDGIVTWQQGLDFVKGVNSGTYAGCGAGYADWRLPNVRELQSLVNFGIGTPVVPNTVGTAHWSEGDPFSNLASSFYWSSSSDGAAPASFSVGGSSWRAWAVNMQTGATWADDKGGTGAVFKVPMGRVWSVRGQTVGAAEVAQTGQSACYDADGNTITCVGTGQDGELQTGMPTPSPRFAIGSGVVTDTLTGLVWLRNADCIKTEYPTYDTHGTAGDGMVTWQQGLAFVQGMNNGTYPQCSVGLNTWRMPNIRELQSLVDFGIGEPIIADISGLGKWSPGNPFINVANSLYWSATSDGHDPATSASRAWAVGIRTGATWADRKDGSGADFGYPMGRVWPVLETRATLPTPTKTYLPLVVRN